MDNPIFMLVRSNWSPDTLAMGFSHDSFQKRLEVAYQQHRKAERESGRDDGISFEEFMSDKKILQLHVKELEAERPESAS